MVEPPGLLSGSAEGRLPEQSPERRRVRSKPQCGTLQLRGQLPLRHDLAHAHRQGLRAALAGQLLQLPHSSACTDSLCSFWDVETSVFKSVSLAHGWDSARVTKRSRVLTHSFPCPPATCRGAGRGRHYGTAKPWEGRSRLSHYTDIHPERATLTTYVFGIQSVLGHSGADVIYCSSYSP